MTSSSPTDDGLLVSTVTDEHDDCDALLDDDSWAAPRPRASTRLRAVTALLAVTALCLASFTVGVRVGRDRAPDGTGVAGMFGRNGGGRNGGGFGGGGFGGGASGAGAAGSVTGNAALDALLGGDGTATTTPTTTAGGPAPAGSPTTTRGTAPDTTADAGLGGLLPG